MPHKTGAADEDMRHRGMVPALVAAQVTSSLGGSAKATQANGGILMQ